MRRNGPGDALTDPPVGVGAEAETSSGVKFLYCAFQAQGAFLHQIQQLYAPLLIFLGYSHHKSKIGLDHLILGTPTSSQTSLEFQGVKTSQGSPGFVTSLDFLLQLGQGAPSSHSPFLFGGPVAGMVRFSRL